MLENEASWTIFMQINILYMEVLGALQLLPSSLLLLLGPPGGWEQGGCAVETPADAAQQHVRQHGCRCRSNLSLSRPPSGCKYTSSTLTPNLWHPKFTVSDESWDRVRGSFQASGTSIFHHLLHVIKLVVWEAGKKAKPPLSFWHD